MHRIFTTILVCLFGASVQPGAGEIPACGLEAAIINAGLVDISKADSTIRIEIINDSPHNILGENVYGCLQKGYLRREALTKLLAAQAFLRA
jgi:D-alanyl-D-alanine dipeptidase